VREEAGEAQAGAVEAGVIALALMLAGSRELPILVGGPEPSLQRFALAAQRCGISKAAVERASFGTLVVALPNTLPLPSDHSALDCAINWMLVHPDLNLGFIGNQATRRSN
jgi:hypothetical protein